MSVSPWIEQEFGPVDFGDKRLTERLRRIVERMWQSPPSSTAAASGHWNEAIGAYRFYDHAAVTMESLLEAHRQGVSRRVRLARLVLHIQDTTELDYTKKKALQGSGPLSDLSRQGFFAHNEYVVQADGLPLGLWHTTIYARDPADHGKAQERKALPIEEKESYRWLEGYRRACQLKSLHPGRRVISMGDRESDIYEVFQEYHQRRLLGQPAADWIIRSKEDRCLLPAAADQDGNPEWLKLHAQVQAAPLLGVQRVRLRTKEQCRKVKGCRRVSLRTGREAVLEIRACQVQLKPPARPGPRKLSPVTLWVVLAQEINAPANQEPIQWVLLTNLRVKTFKKARQLLHYYGLRWSVEVFHKILKSGCRVEASQLKTSERLLPRIILQMVVAWRIHYVSLVGRSCPDLPCSVVFESWEWKPVMVVVRGKGAELQEPTLSQMIAAIAQLGGHLNRPGDGEPGPQTMWRGLQRLHDLALLWQAWC